jgi:hypothetical protein
MIADLKHESFKRREAAERQLLNWDIAVLPALREALKSIDSPEAKRRIDGLITTLERDDTPARVREARAVWVLERIATADAKDLLGKLARGEPVLYLTREANAATARIGLPAK